MGAERRAVPVLAFATLAGVAAIVGLDQAGVFYFEHIDLGADGGPIIGGNGESVDIEATTENVPVDPVVTNEVLTPPETLEPTKAELIPLPPYEIPNVVNSLDVVSMPGVPATLSDEAWKALNDQGLLEFAQKNGVQTVLVLKDGQAVEDYADPDYVERYRSSNPYHTPPLNPDGGWNYDANGPEAQAAEVRYQEVQNARKLLSKVREITEGPVMVVSPDGKSFVFV